MKVSIVIATYNRKEALRASVQSALAQTYPHIETIVVDDGSVDGTQQLFDIGHEFESVTYMRLFKNSGATVARNAGLDAATGDYTLVWDSDDILDSDAIETLVQVYAKFPTATVVSAPTRVHVAGELLKIPSIPEGNLSLTTIACARMPKYKLVRLVRVQTGGHVRYKSKNLDFMVNTELAASGPWIHTARPLGDHFVMSDRHSLTRARRLPNADSSVNRTPHLVEYLESFGDMLLQACPNMFAAHVYGATLGLLLSGQIAEARNMARRMQAVRPRNLRCQLLYWYSFMPFASPLLHVMYKIAGLRVSR